jgi:Zn-dependent protease with chaperone function
MREAFISLMEKLAHKNLAETSPSKIVEFFLYDHPPISKRIALARHFRKE